MANTGHWQFLDLVERRLRIDGKVEELRSDRPQHPHSSAMVLEPSPVKCKPELACLSRGIPSIPQPAVAVPSLLV